MQLLDGTRRLEHSLLHPMQLLDGTRRLEHSLLHTMQLLDGTRRLEHSLLHLMQLLDGTKKLVRTYDYEFQFALTGEFTPLLVEERSLCALRAQIRAPFANLEAPNQMR